MKSEPMSAVLREQCDSTLVLAAKKGESRAFESLVKRYETRMFAVAFRITRNREDAQDVVQQSFHKAFIHLNTFQERSSFSTWLTRIAMNEALMCLRKNRTLSEVSFEDMKLDPESVLPTEIPDTGESPAEIFERQEKEGILNRAMNHLSAELRIALMLRLEERTIEETAEIMGVRSGTLKARLFRARERLRGLLTRNLEFQGRASVAT